MEEPINTITTSLKPPNNKLFKILIIIIGFLIATGLFLNAYLLLKKNNRPFPIGFPVSLPTPVIPSPTSIPDVTANWKTYQNKKFGYEFKYPPTWFLEPTPEGLIAAGMSNDIISSYKYNPEIEIKDPNFFMDKLMVGIGRRSELEKKKPGQTLEEWLYDIEHNSGSGGVDPVKRSKENMLISGEKALLVFDEYAENLSEGCKNVFNYFIDHGDYVFYISGCSDGLTFSPALKATFDLILSTFKFL